jgi:hypothetical protein
MLCGWDSRTKGLEEKYVVLGVSFRTKVDDERLMD